MEIDEFLTRIALSGADPTIFVLYEKGENVTASGKKIYFENRTLKTYTRAEDSSVVGTIDYDDPFPKQIFAMEPEGLRAILAQSANLKIDDTYMVATGDVDFRWKLEVLGKSKNMDFQYDYPDIPLSKDLVARIIRADSVLETTTVSVKSDGKEVVIELTGKVKGNIARVRVPFKTNEFYSLYQRRFVDCLKLVGNNDVFLNVDGYKPNTPRNSRGLGKIVLKDKNSVISYYISEVTRTVHEERQTNTDDTHEKKPDKPSESPESDDIEANIETGEQDA